MTTITFKHGKASAQLTYLAPDLYLVRDVWTEVDGRNQGYAKGVMQKVIDYADQHQFTMLLQAQRYGKVTDPALDSRQLEEFYARYGFEVTQRRPTKMIRHPRS